jgi:hypothetical protein
MVVEDDPVGLEDKRRRVHNGLLGLGDLATKQQLQ